MGVVIEGIDGLDKKLIKFGDTEKFFNPVVRDVAYSMLKEVKAGTPRDKLNPTPHTDVMWKVQKLKDSLFAVENEKTTQDEKHSIAAIINKGRGVVRPVKAKALYIPFTRRAKKKKLGEDIDEKWKYGVDYIFVKKVKAVEGTGFIDNAEKNAQKNLRNGIAKKIREFFK